MPSQAGVGESLPPWGRVDELVGLGMSGSLRKRLRAGRKRRNSWKEIGSGRWKKKNMSGISMKRNEKLSIDVY